MATKSTAHFSMPYYTGNRNVHRSSNVASRWTSGETHTHTNAAKKIITNDYSQHAVNS